MGSSEKTVKRATCFRRSCLSQLPCWRSAWLLQLPRSTTSRSCSSSATPPTTWRCSGEPTSRKPSLLELSRDSATSMLSVMMLDKRPEMEDLMMMVVMTVVHTPPPPPLPPHHHHHLHQPLLKPMCHLQLLQHTPLLPTSPSPISPLLCTSPPQSTPPLLPLPPPTNPAVAYKPYVDEYADTPAVYTW